MKVPLYFRHATACAVFLAGSIGMAAGLCQTKWSDFQTKVTRGENRLSFVNQPGPMKIGMCWWHSRMQRNANYLLEFQPAGAQVSDNEAWDIIKNLSRTDTVQVVSGYKNLMDFSARYAAEMNESMGQWQMSDSFMKFGWANGLASSEVDAGTLANEMDALYEEVALKRNLTYQMLKMPGVQTHAWLVTSMQPLAGNQGYHLSVIDSNSLTPQTYTYIRGMTKFSYGMSGRSYSGMDFVPHTQRDSDYADYRSALGQACGQ